MPTLRLLVAMAGPDQAWSVGDLYTCDDEHAAHLVAVGRAEYCDPPAPATPENAMRAGAKERAVRPRGKARG